MAHAKITLPANTVINGGYCVLTLHEGQYEYDYQYLNTTYRIGAWTAPFACKVIKVETWCAYEGTPSTVTVKQGSTNVCTGNITLATDSLVAGTLTTATGVAVAAGTVLSAYINTGSTDIPRNVQVTITLKIDGHPSWV